MGDFSGALPKDKWVCPNDRQLSLRAKLKSGWSVKTGQLNSYQKPEQMNDDEQERIKNVIKRAETIDVVEQERIGRLVEKLENMKKHVMGNGANQCILCGDEFGILGASSLACHDCRKGVCSKCGVDTLSAQKDPLWLCKICSETREIWKKSGAWFFKGLPKHILPEKKNTSNKYSGKISNKQPKPIRGRDFNTWYKSGKGPQDVSDLDVETSSDDEIQKGMLFTRDSLRGRSARTSGDRTPRLSASSTRGDEEDNMEQAFNTYGTTHAMHHRDSGSDRSIRSDKSATHEHKSLITTGLNQTVLRESPIDDVFEEKYSPDDIAMFGNVEFSLIYDSINSTLHCTIYRARGLRPMDSNGLSDPYVKLHLLPGASKSNKLRTRTVHKTLNPEFNETLTYHGITQNEILKKTLRLSVLDEDAFGHDFIGETRISLKKLKPHQTKYFNVYLDKQLPLDRDEDILAAESNCGKILISLKYCLQKKALLVGIIRCANLPSMDPNGLSDPFIKVQMKPDHLRRKYKTTVQWKNLNPEFNEEFVFDVFLQELPNKTVEITVWDKDYGRTNDYIGGLQIGIASKGERLRHFLHTIKNPDKRHDRWHHLSSEVLSD
uniref:Rabphilin n=1 Tax=Strigamia maritima TaxID=126957 RepID=T1JK29_STRMM